MHVFLPTFFISGFESRDFFVISDYVRGMEYDAFVHHVYENHILFWKLFSNGNCMKFRVVFCLDFKIGGAYVLTCKRFRVVAF